MRSKIIAFALLLLTVCAMSSCLNDDTTDVVYYDDTAITAFTLGDFKYYVTLKSTDGKDSIVAKTATGSSYPVYIDQETRSIYTADSLPVGTDLQHMLISVTAKNGGTALLKKLTSDTLEVINSTDSLDFSVPRTITVYSQSGLNKVDYSVNLVAHQEYADSFQWNNLATISDIAAFKAVKTAVCQDKIFVLGTTENGSVLLSSALSDGRNWKEEKSFASTTDASIITNGKWMACTGDGSIHLWNGETWSEHSGSAADDVRYLAGICGQEIFALSKDGDILMSLDSDPFAWKKDALDDSKAFLPSKDITSCAMQTLTNADINRIIMVGAGESSDTTAVVWSKIVETDAQYDMPWSYQEFNEGNGYQLPNMECLSMTTYDNKLFAIGGKGRNGSSVKAYSKVYISSDCGITWHTDDTRFDFPATFQADGASITSDGKGYIWIVCTGSGQIWRGHINSLVWKIK